MRFLHIILFVAFIITPSFVWGDNEVSQDNKVPNALNQAETWLYENGKTSCNPEEAYNFLFTHAGSGVLIKPVKNSEGKYVDGLDPEFACRLYALIKDNPQISIISAYRSVQKQRELCGPKGKPHGCAPPGTSCHQYGLAVDLGLPSNLRSRSVFQSVLARYKLHLPYSANGHVQCVEHQIASHGDRGDKKGCTFSCVPGGFEIDPNGSYGEALTPSGGIANTGTQGDFMETGEFGFGDLPDISSEDDYVYDGYDSYSDYTDVYTSVTEDTVEVQKTHTEIPKKEYKTFFLPLPDYLNDLFGYTSVRPGKTALESDKQNVKDVNLSSGNAEYKFIDQSSTGGFVKYFFLTDMSQNNERKIYEKNLQPINGLNYPENRHGDIYDYRAKGGGYLLWLRQSSNVIINALAPGLGAFMPVFEF